jgi:hypothetical protein
MFFLLWKSLRTLASYQTCTVTSFADSFSDALILARDASRVDGCRVWGSRTDDGDLPTRSLSRSMSILTAEVRLYVLPFFNQLGEATVRSSRHAAYYGRRCRCLPFGCENLIKGYSRVSTPSFVLSEVQQNQYAELMQNQYSNPVSLFYAR